MKFVFKISAYALVLLGIIHAVLTPVFYKTFSPAAVWFAGAGLALIFLGMLNIAAVRVSQQWFYTLCIVANLVGTGFGILGMIALREIQAIVGVFLLLAVTIGSILARIKA
jgi:hypothetical protein